MYATPISWYLAQGGVGLRDVLTMLSILKDPEGPLIHNRLENKRQDAAKSQITRYKHFTIDSSMSYFPQAFPFIQLALHCFLKIAHQKAN